MKLISYMYYETYILVNKQTPYVSFSGAPLAQLVSALSVMTQESLASAIALSSRPAHACFLPGRTLDGLSTTCCLSRVPSDLSSVSSYHDATRRRMSEILFSAPITQLNWPTTAKRPFEKIWCADLHVTWAHAG